MAVVPGFELGSGTPNIIFSVATRVDGSFVDNSLLVPLPYRQALFEAPPLT